MPKFPWWVYSLALADIALIIFTFALVMPVGITAPDTLANILTWVYFAVVFCPVALWYAPLGIYKSYQLYIINGEKNEAVVATPEPVPPAPTGGGVQSGSARKRGHSSQ